MSQYGDLFQEIIVCTSLWWVFVKTILSRSLITVCRHTQFLQVSSMNWRLLKDTEGYCRTLKDAECRWMSLKVAGGRWRTLKDAECRRMSLKVAEGRWRSLKVTGGHWRPLKATEGHWRPLKVTERHWRSFMLGHKLIRAPQEVWTIILLWELLFLIIFCNSFTVSRLTSHQTITPNSFKVGSI